MATSPSKCGKTKTVRLAEGRLEIDLICQEDDEELALTKHKHWCEDQKDRTYILYMWED